MLCARNCVAGLLGDLCFEKLHHEWELLIKIKQPSQCYPGSLLVLKG